MADYNLGTASGRIVVDGSGAEVGFNVAKTAASAFFDVVQMRVAEVQRLGRRMAVAGATGVTAFGAAVSVAADFEQQMSGVKAVANASEEQFESLRKKALQLGADTVYSASESASAIEELVKAGISVEDVLNGAADAAVALAAAGGTSIPEAATIAANAMNQFELSAEKVPKVADILAGVANTSAADVSTLGQSLSQAGAVANLAGLTFRDTAIALGEMADAGIQGSDAGTSLKTMLNNLIPTTDKQKDLFKELGILTYDLANANKALFKETGVDAQKNIEGVKGALSEYIESLGKGTIGTMRNAREVDKLLAKYGGLKNSFFDANGNVKKLAGIQDVLAKSLKGMTREQKLASLEVLFGADAMRASAILSLEGRKGYQEFSKAVSQTSAADVAATRLDNLAGSVEQMKGSLETAAITIGSVFLPVVTVIVNAITKVINVFNGLPNSVQIAIAIIGLFLSSGLLVVGMILALLPLLASMLVNFIALRAISSVTAGFRIFFATLKAGNGTMAATKVAALTTGGAFQKLTLRMLFASKAALFMGRSFIFLWTAITGPIGIAIAAIAALVLVGVLLYKKWEPFRNLVDQIAAVIREKLAQAWAAILPTLNAAVAAIKQFGAYFMSTILPALKVFGGQVLTSVIAALQKFAAFVASSLLPVLREVGGQVLQKLISAFKEVMGTINSTLIPAVKQLAAVFQSDAAPALQKVWSALQPVVAFLGRMAVVVGGFLLSALMKFGSVFIQYILPILIKVAGFITGVLIDSLVTLFNGIVSAISGIIQIFTGLINFIVGVFTGDWSQAWEGIKQIFFGILDLIVGIVKIVFSIGILKAFSLGFKGLVALVRLGWSAIVAIFKAAGMSLIRLITLPFRLILGVFRRSFGAARGIFTSGFNMIKSIASRGLSFYLAIVRRVLSFIVSTFKSRGANIVGAVRSFLGRVSSFFQSILARVVAFVKQKIENILTFFRELPGKIRGALSSLWEIMVQIGKDIIQGMINGVKAMAGQLADAAKEAVQGAINKAKDLLKIGSPSRVFVEIGENTMKSGAKGTEDSAPRLAKAATNAAAAMIAAYNAGLQKFPRDFPSIRNAPAPATADLVRHVRGDKRDAVLVAAGSGGPSRKPGDSAESRIVKGWLKITEDGRAWFEGIAEDVMDDERDYGSRRDIPRG